jgi:hypothetical protein
MSSRNPNLLHWQHFTALESDLSAAFRYIEPEGANMDCYSTELSRILLAAGSEVDVLCKVLCEAHSVRVVAPNAGGHPNSRHPNIKDYSKAITSRFPDFTKLKVFIPRYGMTLEPWISWDQPDPNLPGCRVSPAWWTSYNDVKHKRHTDFHKANLRNAIDSMAGLFVLVCYICNQEIKDLTAKPWPQLLDLDPGLSSRLKNDKRPGHILPDFRHP